MFFPRPFGFRPLPVLVPALLPDQGKTEKPAT